MKSSLSHCIKRRVPIWFNPFAWAAFWLCGADMEMSCDERVMRELGGDIKNDYSMSLVRMAAGRKILNGSPLAFGEGGMKERVKNVLNFKKRSRVIIIVAVTLVAVLSVGFAVNRAAIDNPFKDLKANDVISITLYAVPPDKTVLISDSADIEKVVTALRAVVRKEKGDSSEYAGQLVQFTLFLQSGETLQVGAYNPFIIIGGQPYKTEYGPCEELNRLGNELLASGYPIPADESGLLPEAQTLTVEEARNIAVEHYPDAIVVIPTGEQTISYTNPSTPVDVYTFDVGLANDEDVICAVSKDGRVFFTYYADTNGEMIWGANTGALELSPENRRQMTLADVRGLVQKIGTRLTLNDLLDFIGVDIGSGLFVMQYEVEGGEYRLIVGAGNMDGRVDYTRFGKVISGSIDENYIDMRYYDVEKYIADGTREMASGLASMQFVGSDEAIDNTVIDLTKNRDVNIHAEDLTKYRLFTNSKKISYSVSGTLAAHGKLILYDAETGYSIMEADLSKSTKGEFTNLTAAKTYYLTIPIADDTVIVLND